MRTLYKIGGCLRADIKRTVTGAGFYLAFVLTAVIQIQGAAEDLVFSDVDILYLFMLSANTGKMQWLMPVVATLAFSSAFFEDIHSKFFRCQLMRVGRKAYLLSKLLICFLSTFLAVAGGVLLYVVFLSTQYPLLLQQPCDFEEMILSSAGLLLQYGRIIPYVILSVSFRAVAAAMWAMLGLCISTVAGSRLTIHLALF